VAGALLAFTFSFDDFIIAFFTSGQDQTVPIYLFASIRRGVSPEVNAIATVLLTVTILAMVVAGLVYRRGQRRGGVSVVSTGDAAVAGVPLAPVSHAVDGAS
jgi:spermidine/putrescine transport system permease protein